MEKSINTSEEDFSINPYPSPIFGELRLNENRLIGEIYIPVGSRDFKDAKDFIVFNNPNGIVVRYYSEDGACDGEDPSVPLRIPVDLIVGSNWKKESKVRIMCFNENDSDVFRNLEDYFKERIEDFQYDWMPFSRYEIKNNAWNAANPTNIVSVKCPKDPFMPRFSKKTDGILTVK